jgi:hypothetical protein
VKTLTVDDQQRLRLPNTKPRQVFRYHRYRGGVIQLVPVGGRAEEPFPRGSLVDYLTPERDEEQVALLTGGGR